jgi:aryl-alcohol dehydrogenase-like predicted oxidoreductase
MKMKTIGTSELKITPLILGGNVFGWTIDEAASFKILDAFVDYGMNCIDTADMYSNWVTGNKGGESETIIGKWFKQTGKRDRVILATKVGLEMGPTKKGLSKSYILQAAEESLKRLQTDHIDLYQSHTDDANTPLEETLDAYQTLIKQGKVRVIGASNYSGKRLAEALKVSDEKKLPRYQCLQPHYNLCERADFEQDLEPLCLKQKIGVIPYFSLASGFLCGKYRSEKDFENRARSGMVKKYLNPKGLQILSALDEVSKNQGSTPTKVALAWLNSRPSITAPIASATNLNQLKELVESTQLNLTQESITLLNEASLNELINQ